MTSIISITEASSIALHSMVLIANTDKNLNVIKISELTGSSKHHVAKILQRLVKDNYLNSNRGPYGGFTLKKKPKEISLLDIYESIEGRIDVADCPVENPECPFTRCILENITKKMTIEFKEFLASKTLDLYLTDMIK
ncbi:MAG: Rrf2 family transcriptional regulator [Marinilabiliales bacterium]|nr:MAG: Rrf2 family transcriptional regulator [Marinilabiliales bacterium]